tara:strand:- start:1687 stop:1812 length:126 start_codon:yes stop_codon:yes gene_type:complete
VKFARTQKPAFLVGWFIGMMLDRAAWKNLAYTIVHVVMGKK